MSFSRPIRWSLEIALLNFRAWQLRHALRLSAREELMARAEVTGWMLPVANGLVGFSLAVSLPHQHIVWSAWSYALLFIILPWHAIYRRRQLKKMAFPFRTMAA
jgi:hypothetical protein